MCGVNTVSHTCLGTLAGAGIGGDMGDAACAASCCEACAGFRFSGEPSLAACSGTCVGAEAAACGNGVAIACAGACVGICLVACEDACACDPWTSACTCSASGADADADTGVCFCLLAGACWNSILLSGVGRGLASKAGDCPSESGGLLGFCVGSLPVFRRGKGVVPIPLTTWTVCWTPELLTGPVAAPARAVVPSAGTARPSAGAVAAPTGALAGLAAVLAPVYCPLQVATGCAARSTGVAANSEAGTVVSRAVLFTNLSAMSTALSADTRLGACRVFCPATTGPDVLVCLLSPASLDAAGLHVLAAA